MRFQEQGCRIVGWVTSGCFLSFNGLSVLFWTDPAPCSPLLAAADNLSSTPTAVSSIPQHATVHSHLPDDQTLSTFSSRTVPAVQDPDSTAPTSTTQPQPAVTTRTTVPSQTSGPGWAAVGPTHREFPSELNIGDDGQETRWVWLLICLNLGFLFDDPTFLLYQVDLKGSHHHSNSPLDPLLAGLLSVFIVTTAVVFTVLFFKFRQRANHPEFHRLQDLPMVRCTLLAGPFLQYTLNQRWVRTSYIYFSNFEEICTC